MSRSHKLFLVGSTLVGSTLVPGWLCGTGCHSAHKACLGRCPGWPVLPGYTSRPNPRFSGLYICHLLIVTPALSFTGSVASVCPDTELNLRDTVLGEVENSSFIALPGKGGTQWANDLKPVCSSLKVGVRRCIVTVQRGGRVWSAHGHSSNRLLLRWVGVSTINLLVSTGLGSLF